MKFKFNQIQKLKLRIIVINMLRLVKSKYTYNEMGRMMNLSPTVINRYIKGKIIPNFRNSLKLYNDLIRMIKVENEPPLIHNLSIDKIKSLIMSKKLIGKRVTKILTSVFDDIPLATFIADIIDVPLIIATNKPTTNIKNMIFEADENGTILFIPKESIKRTDSVVIVSDNNKTAKLMTSLTEKTHAEITETLIKNEYYEKQLDVGDLIW